jgi:hypothetical protein
MIRKKIPKSRKEKTSDKIGNNRKENMSSKNSKDKMSDNNSKEKLFG